jgi:hypothetical protein
MKQSGRYSTIEEFVSIVEDNDGMANDSLYPKHTMEAAFNKFSSMFAFIYQFELQYDNDLSWECNDNRNEWKWEVVVSVWKPTPQIVLPIATPSSPDPVDETIKEIRDAKYNRVEYKQDQ